VSLALFDVRGRQVLSAGERRTSRREQHIELDTSRLEAGVYFYRLRVGARTQSRSLLILH
jgi:hypothetical protein